MALRYDIDFEVGDFTEFDNVPATTTALFVTAVSPITGSESASTNWKSNPQEEASNDLSSLAALGNTWRVGMRVRIDSMSFGTVQTTALFFVINGSTTLLRFDMIPSGSDILVQLSTFDAEIASANIDDASAHTIEARIVRETAQDALDGTLSLWVDGILVGSQGGLTNFLNFNSAKLLGGNFDLVSLRIISGTGHTGGFLVDDIMFRDDDTQIFPPAGASQVEDVSPTFQDVSVDADGTFLYIGGLSGAGRPTLVKMSTALNADATSVFDPDDGNSIGVECGKFNADVVWIAGEFGIVENQIQVSENGGTSFTDVSDNFADIIAFRVGPDSDQRVLIFDDNNPDILETIDNGTTWTTIATGMSTFANAIARLATNVQEAVFGNGTDAPNSNIEYSVNSGVNREDIDAGFPEADVTAVIVN